MSLTLGFSLLLRFWLCLAVVLCLFYISFRFLLHLIWQLFYSEQIEIGNGNELIKLFKKMKTITTKYLSPTNTKGSGIKASTDNGSLTIPYDHSLSQEEAHAKAAVALAKKYNWKGELVSGSDGVNYYFNFSDSKKYLIN